MRLFSLFLIAAAAVANAQTAASQATPAQQEAPKKARVEGAVLSTAGEPIPRAQVRLQSPTSVQNGTIMQGAAYSATTDDAGKFVLDNIDPGRNFQLTAQRTGFVTGRYGARGNGAAAPLSLEAGQLLKGIAITLTPQAVVSGKVTDASGDPVQGVQVMLMRRGYQRGARSLVTQNSASTNDQGEYRFAGVTAGRYYLQAMPRPDPVNSGPAQSKASLQTYFPNSPDLRSAGPLDITAGQELRGIDVRLREGVVYTVRGKVLDAAGAAVNGVSVMSMPKDGGSADPIGLLLGRTQGQTRTEGTFEIRGLTPGSYTLAVLPQTSPTQRPGGQVDVTVSDSDVKDVVLTIGAGGTATVTGQVRLQDGDIKSVLAPAVTGANAQQSTALTVAATLAGIATTGSSRTVIALQDYAPALPISLNGAANTQVNDDGTFKLEKVNPGKYLLNVAALPQGTYVKSAQLGGTDVIRNPVDLTSGGGSLEIVLAKGPADIAGVVTAEKSDSLAGVTVSLWPRDAELGVSNGGIRMATADQNGNFQFQGLRPGVYYVAAWEEIDTGLAQARDFLTQLNSDAEKIELKEGGHGAAQVKLIPGAKIKAAEEKLP